MVRKWCTSLGFGVEEADNGFSAVSRLKADPQYVAIITDLRMPEMNGLEMLSVVRGELQMSMPAIVLSAELDDILESSREYGANMVLGKPSGFHEIRKALLELKVLKEGTVGQPAGASCFCFVLTSLVLLLQISRFPLGRFRQAQLSTSLRALIRLHRPSEEHTRRAHQI